MTTQHLTGTTQSLTARTVSMTHGHAVPSQAALAARSLSEAFRLPVAERPRALRDHVNTFAPRACPLPSR